LHSSHETQEQRARAPGGERVVRGRKRVASAAVSTSACHFSSFFSFCLENAPPGSIAMDRKRKEKGGSVYSEMGLGLSITPPRNPNFHTLTSLQLEMSGEQISSPLNEFSSAQDVLKGLDGA